MNEIFFFKCSKIRSEYTGNTESIMTLVSIRNMANNAC